MPAPKKAATSTAEPEVKFSNLDKVFFPKTGYTKGDMIRYYLDIGPWLLPHLHNRPITMIRFPDGVTGEKFYEKNAPRFRPAWVQTFPVPRREHEGTIDYILINDPESLAWVANLASIELHPFLHRVPDIDTPTHAAFDLDPGEGADLLTCIEVAFLIKDLLAGLKLEIFPKVSGSKGLQLYLPLNTKTTYDITSPFAHAVADLLEKQHPDLIVADMPKLKRRGRVLIDWSQNSRSKTTVSVYSMRGKRDEPYVSLPVTWDELKKVQRSRKIAALNFSPDAAVARVRKLGDLFEPVLKLKQRLPEAFAAQVTEAAAHSPETESASEHDDSAEASPAPRKEKAARARKGRASAPAALRKYAQKRDFTLTAEPAPAASRRTPPRKAAGRGRTSAAPHFVIQKHAASHLHYDFRLEMDGTLKSWAVPKGVPTELGVKRSAFAVEDHPLSYMEFEGTIPKGQYGGGTVMVWDLGTYELLGGSYESGNLKLLLKGKKLQGEWHMFKIRSDDGKDVWLIAKSGEPADPITPRRDDMSVLTRRSMARIAKDNDAQWESHRQASRS